MLKRDPWRKDGPLVTYGTWLFGGFGLLGKIKPVDGNGLRLFLVIMLLFGIGMATVLSPLWRM